MPQYSTQIKQKYEQGLEICRNIPLKSSKSASKGRVLQDEQAKEHTPVCDERFGEARLEICRNFA